MYIRFERLWLPYMKHLFFFFDNHREYIKKAIKPIDKEKYKGYERKKKLIYYNKQQKDCLRFLITPQFDAIRRS